jgi:transcriptional regulator NrdR family protein
MARAAWVRELMVFSVRETPCATSSAQRIKERRRKKREDNIELRKEDGQCQGHFSTFNSFYLSIFTKNNKIIWWVSNS